MIDLAELRQSVLTRTLTFVIILIVTLLATACESGIESNYPTMTPKRTARNALQNTFREAMLIRDRKALESIMSESAFLQISQWFDTNSPIGCSYVNLDYKSRFFGRTLLESPEGVQVSLEIRVPCRGSTPFSRKGIYHLVVEDVVILYQTSGWQIESFGNIRERMLKLG